MPRIEQYTLQLMGDAERPEDLEDGILYVTEWDPGKYFTGWMKCPCGCGDEVGINFLDKNPGAPSWTIDVEKVTVHPSILRRCGCRAHYWIRDGRVVWA